MHDRMLFTEPEMTKILLIDEPIAASYLARGLTEEGMSVEIVHEGAAGLDAMMRGNHELAIFDVLLRGMDGWTLLETARRAGCTTPVLLLTSLGGVDNCIRGLDLGAEDYLLKPFAFSELLARIRSVLRRSSPASMPTRFLFKLADLHVNVLEQRAWRGADRLDLTPKEFALLSALVRHTGEVQARDLLARQVWDMTCGADSNIVEVAIRRLRAKLDDPYPIKLLHTVRGIGYVLDLRS